MFMKLLSAQQIHQWDAFTMQYEPVSSIDLMERAANACVDWLLKSNISLRQIKIFCGKGNNGGDGLAIARLLIERGFNVTVYILEFGAKGTDDFQINFRRLQQFTSNIHFIQSSENFPVIEENDLVIDALFGSGLNRPLKEISGELVQHINQSFSKIISIDVPSGMSIDKSSKGNNVIKANYTLTFQSLKLCFLMAENVGYFGIVHLLNIQLLPEFLQTVSSVFEITDLQTIKEILHPRSPFAHKGNFGHALLIAGNTNSTGAAIMATGAALRTGVGLLTVNVFEKNFNALYATYPEAMLMSRENKLPELQKFNVAGIGCGLGTNDDSKTLLNDVLSNFSKPMIIDADALNIISAKKDLLSKIPANSILTPHPKEFDRVFGACGNDFERIERAIEISSQNNFTLVLKGHYTLIAHNGKGYFNTTGNAGLAKGGSGDTLTGMILALLAQGYDSLYASILGVYLHGLAADLSLENQSLESLLATDVINNIGKAFNFLSDIKYD